MQLGMPSWHKLGRMLVLKCLGKFVVEISTSRLNRDTYSILVPLGTALFLGQLNFTL